MNLVSVAVDAFAKHQQADLSRLADGCARYSFNFSFGDLKSRQIFTILFDFLLYLANCFLPSSKLYIRIFL